MRLLAAGRGCRHISGIACIAGIPGRSAALAAPAQDSLRRLEGALLRLRSGTESRRVSGQEADAG
ncbi:Hypothetical predicted protein [Podarcis lilfordi]|uniref:Uncharacterized protein n=1 Tax=Podarcis lilfordi TaxID=74358 RepID=A0AA35PJ94_9SAUR|nr:Hypothetical predicted protein [Podarcis lilfordi]